MTIFDNHTHNQQAQAGAAIICLPETALLAPDSFEPREGALYSVGVHPWWVGRSDASLLWRGVERLASHSAVVALGECGFDRLHGSLDRQEEVFLRHVSLSERLHKPLIIHCVRATDVLLRLRKETKPTQPWIFHGFRGKPASARQLLKAGMELSFGIGANPETVGLVPKAGRRFETDDSAATIGQVAELFADV